MLAASLFRRMIHEGTLIILDAAGRQQQFGSGTPQVTIRLTDRRTELALLRNPKLALGEAYMDGRLLIESGTLYDLLHIAARNIVHFENLTGYRGWENIRRWLRPLQTYNPVSRARRNVAHHYDLSGDLYDLFLDTDRQYSCAYFQTPSDSLEEAQENKKRHLGAKLRLDEPNLEILDIGSGWGGLGLYLARETGANVTGVTISEEQTKVSQARAKKAGLDESVQFRLEDYRNLRGQYDRIISVGMFEHVGTQHYPEFFRTLRNLLTADGVAVLHSIGRMQPPGATNPWLRKYIFPGGYTPALSEVLAAIERCGLWVTDIEILRLHYAETLRKWRERFQHNRERARKLYDERFCRMWEFYLTGCEISFREMGQMVFQIQLTRKQDSVPLTRDFITDWERAHMPFAETQQAAE